jgi:hypothetical protein
MTSLVVIHPFRLPARWNLTKSNHTCNETTRISANGSPNLSTSVVVPGRLPRAIPVSAIPKSIQKGKNNDE